MCVWFPSVIASSPSNIEFDGLTYKAMPHNFIDKPFVVVGHPKIVELFAFSSQK
jgi:hypothetical protein